MTSNLESINNEFKLPIFYNPKKVELKENIITDLELIQTIDPSSSTTCMYQYVYQPETCFGKKVLEQMPNYYTTDVDYLKDTQTLLKTYEGKPLPENQEIIDLWDEIKNDTGFKDRYLYLDWKFCEHLNYSENFLLAMSLYNMASPVISLLVPFIFLIVPFFILQLRGIKVSFAEYVKVLYFLASQHALGRIFTDFNNVAFQQKMYLVFSAGFYLFSVYQNVLICIRFKNNMKKIHESLDKIKKFTNHSIDTMNHYLKHAEKLPTYYSFNKEVERNKQILEEYTKKLSKFGAFSYHPKKIAEIGHILKTFYELYDNETYNKTFLFTFGFHGYLENIVGCQRNIREKKMNTALFMKKPRKNVFKRSYYAPLSQGSLLPVKNDITLKKNLIITGPNAAGKTTVLKSTTLNIILTQQIGCGFYDYAKFHPYHHIHCYLNIPDTSGRDSLFQAEARRCKEIIDTIDSNKSDLHFCIFDELFSGTNPEEAVISGTAFMTYLVKNKNMNCLLTTHFIDVCNHLEKNPNIDNYKMDTREQDGKIKYTYILKKGISSVKGGFQVLRDMNYPSEIIKNTDYLSVKQ